MSNPVLSTINYFRSEYDAHINEKKCPALACKALITYRVDSDNCTGCGVCLRNCSAGAISGNKKEVHIIDPEACTKCGVCKVVCKFNAIIVE